MLFLLFSLVWSPESYFLWILCFLNFVYCCGKFFFPFSLHGTKTSLKSSIWRQNSFLRAILRREKKNTNKTKPKNLKIMQNPLKSVKAHLPRVLWNWSQTRCCTLVPDFSPQKGSSSDLSPAFVLFTKHWIRDGSSLASHSNKWNDEPNTFKEQCMWVLICSPLS